MRHPNERQFSSIEEYRIAMYEWEKLLKTSNKAIYADRKYKAKIYDELQGYEKWKRRKEMANDIIFVDGLKVKQRFEGLLGVSIKVENLINFIKEHESNGYVNIDICKSKNKDAWFAKLNTWKPDASQKKVTKEMIKEEFDGEEIPF